MEGVKQFAARDGNKLALERDLMGVADFAIPKFVCLTDDSILRGDESDATPVGRLDSTDLLAVTSDCGAVNYCHQCGELNHPQIFLIRLADISFKPADDWKPTNLLAKIAVVRSGAILFLYQYSWSLSQTSSGM